MSDGTSGGSDVATTRRPSKGGGTQKKDWEASLLGRLSELGQRGLKAKVPSWGEAGDRPEPAWLGDGRHEHALSAAVAGRDSFVPLPEER